MDSDVPGDAGPFKARLGRVLALRVKIPEAAGLGEATRRPAEAAFRLLQVPDTGPGRVRAGRPAESSRRLGVGVVRFPYFSPGALAEWMQWAGPDGVHTFRCSPAEPDPPY